MGKVIENVFFLTAVTAAVAFTRWCIREIRAGPPKPRELTQEELQDLWEQQQQEKYERELEWETEND